MSKFKKILKDTVVEKSTVSAGKSVHVGDKVITTIYNSSNSVFVIGIFIALSFLFFFYQIVSISSINNYQKNNIEEPKSNFRELESFGSYENKNEKHKDTFNENAKIIVVENSVNQIMNLINNENGEKVKVENKKILGEPLKVSVKFELSSSTQINIFEKHLKITHTQEYYADLKNVSEGDAYFFWAGKNFSEKNFGMAQKYLSKAIIFYKTANRQSELQKALELKSKILDNTDTE